ncbi:MAG: hypothetical protein QOJ99_1086 [Bryobacterales bacterium]|jgi:hypothetical protein|nr:hypothetical protein [Bryobacterales bacterium]
MWFLVRTEPYSSKILPYFCAALYASHTLKSLQTTQHSRPPDPNDTLERRFGNESDITYGSCLRPIVGLSTFGATADITLRQAIEPSKMHL